MLIVNKPLAVIGLILVFLGGFCPILQVKVIFEWVNWGLYKTDVRLFLITYSFIALMALCYFIRQLKAFRLLTRVMFVWILVMAAAVYFKSTHYFGIKMADNLLGKAIHFQWGWIVLALGALVLLFSVKKEGLKP
ncbi:MAG: hypothetical protein EOO47_06240 [Flavobacterium sp.]|nr:MAG: hypothetical protein EOO47_06240 [Flavobacterium sp.]